MRFEFDTNDLSGRDVLILTAIASALGGSAPQATVGDNGASDTTVPSLPSEVTGVSPLVEDEASSTTSVKRVRRTKAQIEADRLADEAALHATNPPVILTQGQQDAVDDTAGILTTEQTSAIDGAVAGTADATVTLTAEQVAKIVDLDGLRTALQTYTGKHDLAAGIALLGTFACKRISDVLALPADRQQAFLLACHV